MTEPIVIGRWTFDHASYDHEADVLYLSIGPPRRAIGDPTPEGHVLRFDAATGEFCGVTLIGVHAMMVEQGEVGVTLPHPPDRIDADRLGPVLSFA